MALTNSKAGWGWLTRLIHWMSALVILFLLGVGFYMSNFVNDMVAQFELIQTHKSWGFVAFSLAVLRVGWRLFRPGGPDLPDGMSAFERFGAKVSHYALYVLIFAMPLTGWLMASASPLNDEGAYPMQVRNMVFGLFELPDPVAPGSKALAETLHTAHFACGALIVLILIAHAGAALKHHFINRDNVLTRMITGR